MHFEINDNTTLREIQDAFSDFYPHLKIEFYKKPHDQYEASKENDQILTNAKISDIKKTHVSGLLEISPWSRVAEVEKEFDHRFGLSVQVLRKEKDGWVQTTGMDDFTLKNLNIMARNSSDEFIVDDSDEVLAKKSYPMNIEFHTPRGRVDEADLNFVRDQLMELRLRFKDISRAHVHFRENGEDNKDRICEIALTIFGSSLFVKRSAGTYQKAAREVLTELREKVGEQVKNQNEPPDEITSTVKV